MESRTDSQDALNQKDELLAGKVLGNLSDEEEQRLNELLDASVEEQKLIRGLQTVHERMALHAATPLSGAVKQRILATARQAKTTNPQNWLIAGLVMVLAITSTELYRSKLQIAEQSNRSITRDRFPGDRTVLLQSIQEGTTRKAHGEVIVRAGQQNNLLVLHHLPKAPAGMIYRLWAATPSGLQGCVHFLPDPSGTVVMTIPPQPTGSANKLMISLDRLASRDNVDSKPEQPVLTGAI